MSALTRDYCIILVGYLTPEYISQAMKINIFQGDQSNTLAETKSQELNTVGPVILLSKLYDVFVGNFDREHTHFFLLLFYYYFSLVFSSITIFKK